MLSIGEATARMRLAPLRYWEARGLLTPPARLRGQRRYDTDALQCIALVQLWRDTGMMSLDDIATVLNGPAAGADWREIVHARKAAITEQVQRLTSATAYLEHLLGCPRADPAARSRAV